MTIYIALTKHRYNNDCEIGHLGYFTDKDKAEKYEADENSGVSDWYVWIEELEQIA